MQVSFYLKHFPATGGPVTDGTSRAVDGLAAGLVENGAQVTVLCEGPGRSSVRIARGYSVECFANHRPYRTFALAPGLKRYVTEHLARRRGVCLVNGMFHPPVYAIGRWLRRHGVPYVMVPHGPYSPAVFRRNPHLKWPYWYLFERQLLEQARAVQVFDQSHGACLRHLGVATQVIQTENGVALGSVPREADLQWRPVEETARLMFLGRIDAYNKGLDELIDALPQVASLFDVELTLQGPDWGDRAGLEGRAAHGMAAHRIRFIEPDFVQAPPRLIAGHDLFCLPSRVEGFGLAALEAMLAGRVLLVSERAGIARHVRAADCGITVQPVAADIARGLLALLKRRAEWREMGLAGRRYALANLQWKDIAAGVLAQYERITD
ncbi:MAG TPA: glycosyltransferase [Burkholderiales bacterium]|nr:glycosyltransferase [Burkholderiales bacterium]